MLKQAAKWDKLWRAGLLDANAVRKITGERMEVINNSSPVWLGNFRKLLKKLPKLDDLPASQAYAARDASAVRRMELLQNRPASSLLGIPTPDWLLSVDNAYKPDALERLSKIPRKDNSPVSDLQRYFWGDLKSKPEPSYTTQWHGSSGEPAAYISNSHTLLGDMRPGDPTMRHELGHARQHAWAANNPTAFNVQTALGVRRLQKAVPGFAERFLREPWYGGGKDRIPWGKEFQGHLFGALGSSNNARKLVEATRPGPELPMHAFSSAMRNAPVLVNHPEVASAAEHIMRNYHFRQYPK